MEKRIIYSFFENKLTFFFLLEILGSVSVSEKNTNCVRLLSIEICGFKNVGYGMIEFPHSSDRGAENRSEIVGIYGQNGSGKTAVVEALGFLKKMMSGNSLPADAGNYIAMDGNTTTFCFQFELKSNDSERLVWYTFSLKRMQEGSAAINMEKVSFADLNASRKTRNTLIQYGDETQSPSFLPVRRYSELCSRKKENNIKIGVAKAVAEKEHKSFIFGEELHEVWADSEGTDWKRILEPLYNYAVTNLFVILNAHSGNNTMNFAIPFSFKYEEGSKLMTGDMLIRLDKPAIFSTANFLMFKKMLVKANTVMGALIPNLSIDIKEYGAQLTGDGKEGVRFELISKRGETIIPLRYESEGIKKIISMMNIIIYMYNNPSVLVAIDELDAGVYEYLLGELLLVIEETGKGQLLFTSHNLRPLEMIDKSSLLFTTTNPKNRYIHISNVKGTNNLRDLYLRSINLGGQKETIYEKTEDFKIRSALRRAGELSHG